MLFILITPAWGNYLSPALDDHHDDGDEEPVVHTPRTSLTEEPADARGSALPAAEAVGAADPDPVGADGRLDVSRLPLARQVRTPHFMLLAGWALVTTYRVLFILGTVHEQAEYNAGGRSQAAAGALVAWFNGLLMVGPAGAGAEPELCAHSAPLHIRLLHLHLRPPGVV